MSDLPFSQSCENNKQPILQALQRLLAGNAHVLEIAGGTGQHAECFAAALPHLRWQSSDIPSNVDSLNLRLSQAALDNLPVAVALDVNQGEWLLGKWPIVFMPFDASDKSTSIFAEPFKRLRRALAIKERGKFDALFSANSLHIMSAGSATNFFLGAGKLLDEGALLIVYGPFNYDGAFTSPSNAEFDVWLKERNPQSGIRDFETINATADIAGFELLEDNPMPANNRLLVWRRCPKD